MIKQRPMRERSAGRSVACALALALAACTGPLVQAPDNLKPAANESLAMIVAAKGVQIYECRAARNAVAAYEWAFVAPEADLFDAHGKLIGRHGAGPFWQSTDGSRIVGAVKAKADAPVVGAVPWLLLATKSNGPEGSFSKVTSIQRVNTAGGIAPAAGCASESAGTRARVHYTADYYFFTDR
jgi:hypothetical protein